MMRECLKLQDNALQQWQNKLGFVVSVLFGRPTTTLPGIFLRQDTTECSITTVSNGTFLFVLDSSTVEIIEDEYNEDLYF